MNKAGYTAIQSRMVGQEQYTFFFYKNLVYKNIKASNSLKIKNILRTYKGFKSWEKNFAYDEIEKIFKKPLNFSIIKIIFYDF